jgi:hypothetical protein
VASIQTDVSLRCHLAAFDPVEVDQESLGPERAFKAPPRDWRVRLRGPVNRQWRTLFWLVSGERSEYFGFRLDDEMALVFFRPRVEDEQDDARDKAVLLERLVERVNERVGLLHR